MGVFFFGVGGLSPSPPPAPEGSHLRMWATMEGPYQSPALFPAPRPSSTSRWMPKGARGWSPKQATSARCHRSASGGGAGGDSGDPPSASDHVQSRNKRQGG